MATNSDDAFSSGKTDQVASKSKTSAVYWLADDSRLFKFTRGKKTESTLVREDADYSCRIAFGKRREQFNLHTANKAAAASKASAIYRDVVGKGWEEAIRIHKPKSVPKVVSLPAATVGSLIKASMRLSSARAESLDAYAKALRRITSAVMGMDSGGKYDFKNGSRVWREKVDSIPLENLTPARVLAWKNEILKKAKKPEDRNHAVVTVNSLLRNSKALLSKKIIPFISQEIPLPSQL